LLVLRSGVVSLEYWGYLMADNTKTELTWINYAGAWLGIGTSPAALLLGSQIAIRYSGAIPIYSVLLAFPLVALILWSIGSIGLKAPHGLGLNLAQITPLYFNKIMQRVIGGVLTFGMIGWFGFNSAFGAAAFFSVFLFMFKGRTATFAGLVNRLTSLVAGTTSTVIFYFAFQGRFPKPTSCSEQ